MRKDKIAVGLFTLLLAGMLVFAFNIQRVEASGTIYIRADGSVEGTNKIQREGNIYTFTDNIYDEIVVERDNIVVDGASYTLEGTGSGTGIGLSYRSNVTIRNMEIKSFGSGIWLYQSSNNTITGNDITNNTDHHGILLSLSSNNVISGNNIADNINGINLRDDSLNNVISGNDIANNRNGVTLSWSSNNNTISGNKITNNDGGSFSILLQTTHLEIMMLGTINATMVSLLYRS